MGLPAIEAVETPALVPNAEAKHSLVSNSSVVFGHARFESW